MKTCILMACVLATALLGLAAYSLLTPPKKDTLPQTQAVPSESAVECRSEAVSPMPTVYGLAISCDKPIFEGQASPTSFALNDLVLALYHTEGVDNVGLESRPSSWRYAILVIAARDRSIREVEDRVAEAVRKFYPNLKFSGSQK